MSQQQQQQAPSPNGMPPAPGGMQPRPAGPQAAPPPAGAPAWVLRDLGNGWQQCQDSQGIFYWNTATQQSANELPPELRQQGGQMSGMQPKAAPPQQGPPGGGTGNAGPGGKPQVQVMMQLGGNWLQCQDEQGIFYFNTVTQQSSTDMPPEARQQPAPKAAAQPNYGGPPQGYQGPPPQQGGPPGGAGSPPATVLAQLSANWLQCQDAQGIFYWNSATQQSSDEMPLELQQQAGGPGNQQGGGQPIYPPGLLQPPNSGAPPGQQPPQQQQAPPGPGAGPGGQAPAQIKQVLGNWSVCADAQGEFYWNNATQQSFDTPPPELMQLLQQQRNRPQQPPQQIPPRPKAPNMQRPPMNAPPPGGAPAEVLGPAGGDWLQCQDSQGIFYWNTTTQQSADELPPEVRQANPAGGPQQAWQGGPPMGQGQSFPDQPPGQLQGSMNAQVKATLGVWSICQDAQGEFYWNNATQQSFDQPPPELAHLMRQQQQQGGPQQPGPANAKARPPMQQAPMATMHQQIQQNVQRRAQMRGQQNFQQQNRK
eukprot:gnl/TRDRNA2_/TRDRNA2_161859_c0_seq3.p1 gnl/TRDRNA2_/TRDRNA2_161859_c0~~gnl/TRDRNA2_/TRDRNA2_161859_c0_seq3.p1  ORF type:complete len:536 (-),score=91.82 gnl/TRDRNA2_/TRDRNA2_161859_c0_seq3:183-1790(-)